MVIGKTISHYQIQEKRGGGMGVVYKTHDTRQSYVEDARQRVSRLLEGTVREPDAVGQND